MEKLFVILAVLFASSAFAQETKLVQNLNAPAPAALSTVPADSTGAATMPPVTGKVIDWNEINVRDDEDWYYDENEYLWKKFKPEDEAEDNFPAGEIFYEMIHQNRKLHCAGCYTAS